MLYGGSISPGNFQGHDVTIQDVFEAVGAHAPRRHERRRSVRPGEQRLSRRRRLRRPVHRQHHGLVIEMLGIAPMGDSSVPAGHPDKDAAAQHAGELVMHLVRARPAAHARSSPAKHWKTPLPASPPAADPPTPFCICWPSRSEAGVPLAIDDFDRISARTPLLADLKPGGRFVATDLYDAGGVRLLASRLREAGALHADRPTVTGKTLARRSRQGDGAAGTAGRASLRRSPCTTSGGLVILKGNLAPEGCVVKIAGHTTAVASRPGARLRQRRGRLRRRAAGPHQGRRRGRHSLRRSARRPRHARDAGGHRGAGRRRPGRFRRAAHRRTFLRRHPRPDGRPRRARKPPAAGPSPPCAPATSSRSTFPRAACRWNSATRRFKHRLATWTPPPPRFTTRRHGQVRAARFRRPRWAPSPRSVDAVASAVAAAHGQRDKRASPRREPGMSARH